MTTPTQQPRRKTRKLGLRVSEQELARIVERAVAADVTRSHEVRRMLTYAVEHMPPGYAPTRAGPRQSLTATLSIRVADRGLVLIVERAAAVDVTPSHMARRMLDYAVRHAPPGYVPGRGRRSSSRDTGGKE